MTSPVPHLSRLRIDVTNCLPVPAAFRFTVGTGLFFSVAMGLLGGFFPAGKAARANVVDSLRQA